MHTQNTYSVPPPYPPIVETVKGKKKEIKVVLFIAIFLMCFNGVCSTPKIDTVNTPTHIPEFDTLINSLQLNYTNKAVLEIYIFTYVEKFKWLKFAPSFGWNFISNTPFIGYNSSQLFDALNYKRKKKAVLDDMLLKINQEYRLQSIQLLSKCERFNTLWLTLNQKKEILRLEYDYLILHEELYTDKQIGPSKWLQLQIAFRNKLVEYNNFVSSIQMLREEILMLSYYGETEPLFETLEDVPTN